MLLGIPDQATLAQQLFIEAAGQRYKQTGQYFYLGGKNDDRSPVIDQRICHMRDYFTRFGPELYDRTTAHPKLTVPTPTAEVIESWLYGCVM